jgi:hypothetical protein
MLRSTLALLAALGLLVCPAVVDAQAVAQSYTAGSDVQQGMIVALDSKDATRIRPLTSDNIQAMQGVVVPAHDSAVTLTSGTSNQVYVATTGDYNVLVSTQAGPIKSGDYITISSLGGIGMKAGEDQSIVLGKAKSDFDGSKNVSGTMSLQTSNGTTTTVALGLVEVSIGISHNPLAGGEDNSVPGFLRKASQAIADKPVSKVRIYMSLVVLLLTVVIVGSFLYGSGRSSLKAIGRNPLARRSIVRGMFQVTLIGLIIFVIGLFAVYLILKL